MRLIGGIKMNSKDQSKDQSKASTKPSAESPAPSLTQQGLYQLELRKDIPKDVYDVICRKLPYVNVARDFLTGLQGYHFSNIVDFKDALSGYDAWATTQRKPQSAQANKTEKAATGLSRLVEERIIISERDQVAVCTDDEGYFNLGRLILTTPSAIPENLYVPRGSKNTKSLADKVGPKEK